MFWIHFLDLCQITVELGTTIVTDATDDVYRAWIVKEINRSIFKKTLDNK